MEQNKHIMTGVREHTEGYSVSLGYDEATGRLSIIAKNEGGNNETVVDFWDLLEYMRLGPPESRAERGFFIG